MVNITVHLTPALTGYKGEMWVMFLVGGIQYWYKLLDIPLSVNGVIGPFGYIDPYTANIHQIRFPEQTINGVTYQEAQTGGFMTNQDRTFNKTLIPKDEPSKSSTLTISTPESVAPNDTFNITGILHETGAQIPIPNQIVTISQNGVTLGNAITGIDGDYVLQASIRTEGSYTLEAVFAGTPN